ncbi:hypothetical protein AHMF7605_10530 [Adhaeribacter arboris]|uniref:Uncharacterized protein n=1 Tax=Adhaeribacter arboris TaxID=2072846 RepID=A0A2T2YEJ3_9BACT|nr:hypothetical protein [Adhaeribacter arboris]PSR53922.1 hypothetical protein AHMF7605_10530 [Adhaeribacter arboris]
MGEIIPGSKHPLNGGNVTLAVGLSTVLATLANLIKDAHTRQIAVSLSPPTGYGLAFFIKWLYRELGHWRACKLIKEWIKELQTELHDPNTPIKRKTELLKQIDEQRQLLRKRQIDNLDDFKID